MARINLSAKNGTERRILEYLEANASEALAAKINAGRKTLADALKYCEGQARELHGGGCVCVEDATVFGWAVHYFEEQRTEDGERGTEDGGQKTEDGCQEAKGNKQNAVGNGEEVVDPFEGVDIFGGAK